MKPWKIATIWGLLLGLALPAVAEVEIQTRTLTYQDDGQVFVGYLAMPADMSEKRPGVLVVHEWWGINDYIRDRTEALARLGYVALAADVYGQGQVTDDPQQAAQWAAPLRENRELLRDRLEEALETLEDLPGVDDDRLAVVGFCFGGTAAVELGYESDDIKGVVSFHGHPLPALAGDDDIKARFLILHGNDDPLVSDEDLAAFTQPLDARGVDHRIVRYDGARHAFTNPEADRAGNPASAYHPQAAAAAWQEMQTFLQAIFART